MTEQRVLNDSYFSEPDLPLAMQHTHQRDLVHHMHTFIELVMVVEGSGTHVFESERYPITVGDVFVIPPYTPHGYENTRDLAIYNILFKEEMLARYQSELELVPGFHGLIYLEPYYRSVRDFAGRLTLTPEQIVQATSLITRLDHESKHRLEGRKIMVETLFVELLLFYCRRFSENTGSSTRVMPVARAIGYMNQRFAEPICLDDLVQVSGLSKRSLIRHFKNTTGFTPIHYLQKVRVAKACAMLEQDDQSVTRTALDAGFNDPSYFSTVFRRHMGVTPSQYARMRGTDGFEGSAGSRQ
jgi:AraC-like DNA-binding protein